MLTNQQKNIILKNGKEKSAKKIAKSLNLKTDEVENFLATLPIDKTPFWYYLVLFLLPFLFIIIAEFSLRIFNYGNDYKEWVSISNKYEILNPDIALKYFNGIKNIPFSTESFLLTEKPEDSFRIIIIGASSAAGYPYQNSGSFSKYIRRAFKIANPNKKIEVANISMAAINSYTILDLVPSIIQKKPDLILTYLGHNEYYGALGAGSNQSIGNNRFIINLVLKLKELRLFQLLENLISYLGSKNISAQNSDDGTLMSKIAGEKLIEFNSDLFNKGVEQFEGNLNDIFSSFKSNNIPVIVGTLASNLKDLKPFISSNIKPESNALIIFNQALSKLKENKFGKADSLFRLAKDLDGLRFRAPEKFNEIIFSLSRKFNFSIVNADSVLNSKSKNGIIGDELMVDHLHPNLKGYQIIGKIFFEKIIKDYFTDFSSSLNIDSLVKINYNFTKFDSSIADIRVKTLKNDWPFIDPKNKIENNKLIKINTYETKIAKDVLDGNISRLDARLKLCNYYLKQNQFDLYINESLAMIEEFPTEKKRLNDLISVLIKNEKYLYAGSLLNASYLIEPDVFNTKWLGIMNVSNNNNDKALFYLLESYKFNSSDPQVLFNLAGIYYNKENLNLSYKYVLECIKISPNYKNANIFKSQLEKILTNKFTR